MSALQELTRLVVEAPRLYGATAAADLLDVTDFTIRKLWDSGELGYIEIGRGRKVSSMELARWISENETQGSAQGLAS